MIREDWKISLLGLMEKSEKKKLDYSKLQLPGLSIACHQAASVYKNMLQTSILYQKNLLQQSADNSVGGTKVSSNSNMTSESILTLLLSQYFSYSTHICSRSECLVLNVRRCIKIQH